MVIRAGCSETGVWSCNSWAQTRMILLANRLMQASMPEDYPTEIQDKLKSRSTKRSTSVHPSHTTNSCRIASIVKTGFCSRRFEQVSQKPAYWYDSSQSGQTLMTCRALTYPVAHASLHGSDRGS